jgi:tetratricopeptide (TPR) repeat protein
MTRYNEDLDYLIKDVNITGEELEEIIREADSILTGKSTDEEQKITALLKRTQALQKLEKYDESREYVERILKSKPEMPQALVRLGNIYDKKKEYDKAVADYSRAIELKPDYARAYYIRGTAYGCLGEFDKAVADYSRAIELKPDHAEAYRYRGNAYAGLKEYDKVVVDYSRAIELQPDLAMAYNNRGNAYGGLGEHGKAVADYSRAIELKPDYARAYFNRGVAYAGLGELDKAVADYSRAIELKPDYAEAYFNRGNAYARLGKHGKAVADYSHAVELKPDLAEVYTNRGGAYVGLGELDKGVADCSRAIELKPDLAEAYTNRGAAYARLGKHGKAVADYSRAIELKPDLAGVYTNRGVAYVGLGELDKGVADCSRAIELKPDFAEAYHNRSVLFGIQRVYDKAFQDELKCLKHIQNSQNYDTITKIQRNVGYIIKNSGSPDFIWNSTKDGNELEGVPNFFSRIIGSFVKEGFTSEKYKGLVNAVIELWKSCYGVDHNERDEAVVLYHYTSMAVLRAMFDSQCLRLSPASYLNDPNEGKTVFTYLKEKAKTKALKEFLEKIQEEEAKSEDIIFIRSFTDKKDNLVMWDSSYADNGRGVSIGIPAPLVNKGLGTPEPVGLMLNADTASPNIGKQRDQPIPLELIGLFKIRYDRDCVKEIADCLNKFDKGDFSNDKLTELTARLFVPIAALVKNEDYQHESEYRLVYIASWGDDTNLKRYIKQTPEDGVYLETEKVLFERFDKFEDDYPSEEYVDVYIGPRVDKITCLKCFDSFQRKYPDVKIESSSIEWQ